MKKINVLFATLLMLCLSVQTSFSQDLCQSIGWANYDGQTYAGLPVGGGNVPVTEVTTFAQLKDAVESPEPRVIHIMNTMGIGDVLNFKSNKTVVGIKPGIKVYCFMVLKGIENIIIRNIQIQGLGKTSCGCGAGTVVEIENTRRVWVGHCIVTEDGSRNLDIMKGSDNVSITWCIFTYSQNNPYNQSNLLGLSDSEPQSHGKLNTSFFNCWWRDARDRLPRVRYGKVHVVNCLYNMPKGLTSTFGIRAGIMANTRVENCDFYNISHPVALMPGTTEGVAFPFNCRFSNCTGDTAGGSAGGYTVFTPSYEYKSWMVPVESVKAQVEKLAGNTLSDPANCSVITALEDESILPPDVAIYPNPIKSTFHLKTARPIDIQVMDVKGRLYEEYKNVSSADFGGNLNSGL